MKASEQETLLRLPPLAAGCLPLEIAPLERAASSPGELRQLLESYHGERYMLSLQGVAAVPPGCPAATRGGRCGCCGCRCLDPSCNSGGGSISGRPWWRRRRGHARIAVTLREDAGAEHALQAVLQAGHCRRLLCAARGAGGSAGGKAGGNAAGAGRGTDWCLREARKLARRQLRGLVAEARRQGWQLQPFLLSSSERVGYSLPPG